MRVVLVEDHHLVRAGLRLLLEEGGHRVVGEFARAEEALSTPWEADLVLLDLNLPGQGGLEALPLLAQRAPVLVVSMHDEPAYVARAFQLGARGYLPKHALDQDLLEALERLRQGLRYLHPSLTEALLEGQRTPTPEVLSPRERALVGLLAQGYTLSQAAEALGISLKTASTYKQRAMNKLGLMETPELVRWAREQGLA
ncbi:response regulator containing a CheY-like receiver domain and an HTH DNA-binding domain [Thermus oshimai JL-2]|uniref:Response regulator containing a CheY-like receiver domain and an HTH DNA-binding domain n=1 Tax=Thermus oshimai JL-2 TaxID=751945 RepID=K7QWG3_THEOS|nr:response regulator transcription factor [Thermus oshimai]AFV75813.1 response regulator containing a CheY-like receiver domain and an HTH DNA-binding domain [Thermus oshimai JL-2]